MSVRARQMALAFDRRRKDTIYREPGNKRRRNRLLPVKPDKEGLISSGELGEELLPGIANEITLIHIVPKLPWKSFLALSSVCREWKRALRAGHHRYYDERVRSNSTETLAVVDVKLPEHYGSHAIALYSVRDERFYYVPPIPGFGGFPSSHECVFSDGKLYVLGGLDYFRRDPVCKEVYVLDLVGERQWRQCASMRRRREDFACVVMDGKIYVHGGTYEYEPVLSSEIYDPELNSWSLSRDSWGTARFQHRMTVVGDEIVLHGGKSYNYAFRPYIMWKYGHGKDIDVHTFWARHLLSKCTQEALFLEFYNPVTKRYRIVRTFRSTEEGIVPGTQGNFYSISWEDIHTHHVDAGDAITDVRIFSGENVLPLRADVDHHVLEPFVVAVVENELLAVVRWFDTGTRVDGSYLVRSRGYSAENSQPISWEKAGCSGKHNSPVIERIKCSIQL